MEIKLAKLRRFNLIMGAFHLIQGAIMLFLATSVIQKIAEFQPTITQNYLSFNVATKSLELASKPLFTLPFGILVASFLFISAAAHLIIYLRGEKYLDGIRAGTLADQSVGVPVEDDEPPGVRLPVDGGARVAHQGVRAAVAVEVGPHAGGAAVRRGMGLGGGTQRRHRQ